MSCPNCGRRAKEGRCPCGARITVRRSGDVGRQVSVKRTNPRPAFVVVNGQMEKVDGR